MRPRILNIWMVVTSVERPCRMMSVQGITDDFLAVKGEAMLASPGFTIGACQADTDVTSSPCCALHQVTADAPMQCSLLP